MGCTIHCLERQKRKRRSYPQSWLLCLLWPGGLSLSLVIQYNHQHMSFWFWKLMAAKIHTVKHEQVERERSGWTAYALFFQILYWSSLALALSLTTDFNNTDTLRWAKEYQGMLKAARAEEWKERRQDVNTAKLLNHMTGSIQQSIKERQEVTWYRGPERRREVLLLKMNCMITEFPAGVSCHGSFSRELARCAYQNMLTKRLAGTTCHGTQSRQNKFSNFMPVLPFLFTELWRILFVRS